MGVCLGARVLKLVSSARERMSRIYFVPFFVEAFRCGPFFPDVEGFPLSAMQLCEIELWLL